jgi:hypothetical protein
MKIFWTISSFLLLASTVRAQDIPPLAPLRGDAANLVDTMKFIQDKLPGTVNFMIYEHDNLTGTDAAPIKVSVMLTQVSADAGRCSIKFHGRADRGVNSSGEHETEILLRQVQEVSLSQMETMQQREAAKSGHPERTFKIDPPIAVLVIKWAPNLSRVFSFYDESLAERVSMALKHAVSLCGGGKPETF